LACDGLFDCVSNEEAVEFVRGEIAAKATSVFGGRKEVDAALLSRIAKALVMEAGRRLGHHDDITVLIVYFDRHQV
jgi:serine/threonine protein phosphatase PrpC